MMSGDEDQGLPVTISNAQGVAVGTHITQHNYFVNSALPGLGSRGRSAQAHGSRPPRVFISSASGALAPYRAAAIDVCHRVGFTPVYMEDFDPQRPPPEEVCRAEVESCDVFVLLLAHRYGSRLPGQRLSYTELEYGWALSRPRLPLLAFVVDPAFPWPPPDIDHGADADALAQFVTRVRSRHHVKVLGELGAFREDLIVALKKHEAASPPVQDPEARAGEARRQFREPPPPPAFHAVPGYVGSAPFTGRSKDLAVLDDWGASTDGGRGDRRDGQVRADLGMGTGPGACRRRRTGRADVVELLRRLRVDDQVPAGGARLHHGPADAGDQAAGPG